MSLGYEDMLRELELLPAWKLRDAGGDACATTAPVAQAFLPASRSFQAGSNSSSRSMSS